jgi:hypothetical protein
MTDLPNHPAGVSLTPSFSDDGVALRKPTDSKPIIDTPQDERPEAPALMARIFTALYAVALIGLLLTKTPALT